MDSNCGTLNDSMIIEKAKQKKLICEDFSIDNVKQACYELRVGKCYYDLSSNSKKIELKEKDYVILKPHQCVVIITKEKLDLPKNILGRILTKGSLFSLGILPVNTYADPGFYGRLGIVLHNSSNEYLKLSQDEPIAKISFEVIQQAVKTPYHGQHGYESEIWPIKREEHVMSDKEINSHLKYHNDVDEVKYTFGEKVGNLFSRVLFAEKRFLIVTIAYIILNLIFIGVVLYFSLDRNWFDPLLNVFIGIITNFVYGIIAFIINNGKKKK